MVGENIRFASNAGANWSRSLKILLIKNSPGFRMVGKVFLEPGLCSLR